MKHRQVVYISDPCYPKYRSGQFTGWLSEGNIKIAYVEVFDKSSRKAGHLETVCIEEKFLSTTPPVNVHNS